MSAQRPVPLSVLILAGVAAAGLCLLGWALLDSALPAPALAARPAAVVHADDRAAADDELEPLRDDGPSPLPSERVEFDPVRARVRLRGQLLNTHGLGTELELTLARHVSREIPIAQYLEDLGALPLKPTLDFASQLRELEVSGGLALRLVASADGTIDADVTELFEDVLRLPSQLSLCVRHENFAEREYVFEVDGGELPIDAFTLATEDELSLEFERALEPRCVVRGYAWPRAGGAREVHIEAWTLRHDRPLGLSAYGAVLRPDEPFALPLELEREYAIVAMADGFVPMTQIVATNGALDLWCQPFLLDDGIGVQGQVALDLHLFGGDATLFLTPFEDDSHGSHGPSGLRWNGSSFSPELVTADCAADGSFDVRGLVRGRYALRIGIDRARWTEMDPVYEVWAPSSGLVLTPPLVNLTWRIEHDGAAVADKPFKVLGIAHGNKRASLQTDRFGYANAWMLSGEPYIVEVPMGSRQDWTYGKVVPWNRPAAHELIAMGMRY